MDRLPKVVHQWFINNPNSKLLWKAYSKWHNNKSIKSGKKHDNHQALVNSFESSGVKVIYYGDDDSLNDDTQSQIVPKLIGGRLD